MRSNLSPLEVVALIGHHLRPILGWRTAPFLAAWAVRLPSYRERFSRLDDDPALAECKRTFLPLAALHHELVRRVGEERARFLSEAVALDVATRLQRRLYLGPLAKRTWDAFHREHDRQMESGFLRHNKHSLPLVTESRVEFQITRCAFYEAMCAIEIGPLTEAFCRSDELVFNEYLPEMRFHRDERASNTIARGATACGFIFERSPTKS